MQLHSGAAPKLSLRPGIATRRITRMLDWTQCPAVERIPGKVSGERLFKRHARAGTGFV